MRVRSFAPVSTLALLGAAAACSFGPDWDSFSGGDGAAPDATGAPVSGADATARDGGDNEYDASDATDGSSVVHEAGGESGAPNQVLNGDFELGCAGWTNYKASASVSSDARSGKSSCLVCSTGSAAYEPMAVYQLLSPAPKNGQKMLVEAWVKAAPGTTALSPVAVWTDIGGISQGEASVVPSTTWQSVSSLSPVHDSATGVSASIGSVGSAAPVPTGRCFLVDDVTVTLLP